MAATEVPFDLLEVKLAEPLIRSATVAKEDVIEQLRTSGRPFASIVAPAGYGKTTLLARWAEADSRPFAWVSLDARDDDAVVFLRYVAAAIHRVVAVPVEVFDALSGPGSTWPLRVGRLGTALAELEQPLVLVLDDLHTVSNPSCLDALAELVRYVPTGSQIVIASREEPDLPLARWRAQGWVEELGVTNLRLDDEEAGFLLAAAGVELEPGQLARLNEHAEGWPAGLYLAALSVEAGAPMSEGSDRFAGDDRYVSEYFRLELLSRLPADEALFLKRSSMLDRMSGALCDSVLESTQSIRRLDMLARSNGFVVPLDRRGEWFRYHHLFGQLLRHELARGEPELVHALNQRAMAWCIDNGLPEDAVVYGHAAGDTASVAGLVDALALPVYYDGREDTVEEWLSWFADDELTRYPALAVYGAWIRVLTGRPDDGERWLELADGATSTIPLSDGSSTIEPWVATLRAYVMKGGAEKALADAELALDQLPSKSGWVPVALLIRGVAQVLLGEADRATESLVATVERGLAVGAAQPVYVAQAQLALLAARKGAWLEAREYAAEAHALVDEAGLGDYGPSAIAHVAVACVALHEGRQDEARAALARAHRLRPMLDHGIPWLTVQVGLELTRAHLALGEAGAACTIFLEAQSVLESRPQLGSLVDDARELGARVVAATSAPGGAWAMSLTGAELRLLPYLVTHLTFPEIARRLFLSKNTIKTEAVSIYRKLSASSRSEAIERAIEVGLLDGSIYPQQPDLTRQV